MCTFKKLADRYGLYIIEDAAPNIEDLGWLCGPHLGVQLLCHEPEARTAHRRLVSAQARPFIISINRCLDAAVLLGYNLVVIAPGGQGGVYRISSPNKYLVLFDSRRFEIDAKEIEKLAAEKT
jgi:hypothetical protein